jgi:hypothetical protein
VRKNSATLRAAASVDRRVLQIERAQVRLPTAQHVKNRLDASRRQMIETKIELAQLRTRRRDGTHRATAPSSPH